MPLKKTPFFDQHKKHNARMTDFGGWLMPVQYTRIQDEHCAVRRSVGLFDVSHMGNILITGKDAERFADYLVSNSVAGKKPYKVIYSPMLNERGGIVDDLLVYKYNRDKMMLVVNASNIQKDLHWIKSQSFKKMFFDVKIQDLSEETAILALQGPNSTRILERMVRKKNELRGLRYYTFYDDTINGLPVTVSRTGYTGEVGYEIYLQSRHADQFWHLLLREGKSFGLTLCGLGARDSLRLEKCYSLYGNDINETTTPLEADLKWTVNFRKDFIGKSAIEGQVPARKIAAFEMLVSRIPRHDYKIFSADDREVGRVTSGGISFTLKKNIGMGYVETSLAKPGTPVKIDIRGEKFNARIVQPPFVK